ncbi:nuak family kinase 1 isoform X2 [Colletes latitarsis]|uniref:nuak family kinase 1 isoform X2 n=1 Tax=Colletes latitarsis TaxID=2605962 RepID=UPI0040361883
MVVGEASIHNIMGGMESTGGVRLHNHKRKLKQRFDIIKKLGQGTYGKVQLGINKETGQEVAIKTIKKCKIETEADLIRIRREIQIMSSVQHPNIIHIYEVFENREKMVLVMEYAAGGELYDYLSERKVLTEHEARRIFRQIATAVFYCHKHKICHRDLKLENILLDQAGNAKIADFGLSNVFDEQRLLNTFCGSPLYASPEIVKGTPYHGPEVDCWSLGVLLYTLVYGAMPFDGSNFKRLVKQISQSAYFEPKKPSPASPLIKDMLTVCPGKRADVERICTHWWVNEGYEQNCLDIAEELAAQTPVRLDLLLSLVPPSASAEKLVVGDQQAAGDVANNVSSETLVPTRCHSVGSLMELDQNNSDRRIRELLEEEPRSAAAGDAKRKLETTPSMDETAAAGVKRKERSRRKDRTDEREPRAYRSASRHHSAPIPNSITEEAMEVDPVVTVPTSNTIDTNKVESSAACLELIKECNERSPSKERSKTPVMTRGQDESSVEKIKKEKERVEEDLQDERAKSLTENAATTTTIVEKLANDAPKFEAASKADSRENEPYASEETINLEATQREFKKLKEKALSLDSELSTETRDVPARTYERRRSKIFETAEKFNQMASNVESEKPKKIFIPGVNVGGAKRVFERKASLSSIATPPPTKPSASKIILDVPTDRNEKPCDKPKQIRETRNEEEKKRDEAKKRAVDIITGAIGKPPMQRRVNGSPPISPSSHETKKLPLKIPVGTNDFRTATVSCSTPVETSFSFDSKSVEAHKQSAVSDEDDNYDDDSQPEEPKRSSKMEITLKSATLPRSRKTSKAEICLSSAKSVEPVTFRSEVEAKIDAFQPQKLRTQRSEIAFPVAAAVPQTNRSASLEPDTRWKNAPPKERIIPIQMEGENQESQHSSTPPPPPPAKPPMPQRLVSQRSGSLSRQSTADSDTDSALGSTVGPEPIRKSPREYIIPIAVEGGGYVTPRSGSVEPESKTSTPSTANAPRSRFSRPRRMSSFLSDASEDESPFSTLHRDSEDLLQRHMHRLRSSRPSRQPPEHADSLSSGEDDDDDGFELLTAENLFSTLLSRVRSLTQRLNVDDNRTTGFPSSRLFGRLGSNSSQAFWGLNKPLSSYQTCVETRTVTTRLTESQFRHSLSREGDVFSKKDTVNSSNPGTPNSPGSHGNSSRETVFDIGSNTLPRDKIDEKHVKAEPSYVRKEAQQESVEQNFTPSLARRLSKTFIEQTRQQPLYRRSISRETTGNYLEGSEIGDRSESSVSDQTEYKDRSSDRTIRRTNSLLEPTSRDERRLLDDEDEEDDEEEEESNGHESSSSSAFPRHPKTATKKPRREKFRSYRTDKIQEETILPQDAFPSWKIDTENPVTDNGSTSECTSASVCNSNTNLLDGTSSVSAKSYETSPTESSSNVVDYRTVYGKSDLSRNFENRLLAAENLIKESKLKNLGPSKFDPNLTTSYRDTDKCEKQSLISMSDAAKRRSCIPSLRLRSGSLSREPSSSEDRRKSLANTQDILATRPAASEKSILSKLLKAASGSRESNGSRDKEKPQKSKQHRISRFLRPDFFDTPREESRYAKEKEAQKAAENERRKSRFIRKKTENKASDSDVEHREKESKNEIGPPPVEETRNSFLHSLEKKLEKLRSNEEPPTTTKPATQTNGESLREHSAPPTAESGSVETGTAKKTASADDLTGKKKKKAEQGSRNRVSSVLGLFKTTDAKQPERAQNAILSRLKRSPPKRTKPIDAATVNSSEDAPSTSRIPTKLESKSTKKLGESNAKRSPPKEKPPILKERRASSEKETKIAVDANGGKPPEEPSSEGSVEKRVDEESVDKKAPKAKKSPTKKPTKPKETSENSDAKKKKIVTRTVKKVAKKSSDSSESKTEEKEKPTNPKRTSPERVANNSKAKEKVEEVEQQKAKPAIVGRKTSPRKETTTVETKNGQESQRANRSNLKLDLSKIPQHSFRNSTATKKDSPRSDSLESPKTTDKLMDCLSKVTHRANIAGNKIVIEKPLRAKDVAELKREVTECARMIESRAATPAAPSAPAADIVKNRKESPIDYASEPFSPVDEAESFDSWSISSAELNHARPDLHSPTSPTQSLLARSDNSESVIDRIRRRSFYSRFNDRRRPSLTAPPPGLGLPTGTGALPRKYSFTGHRDRSKYGTGTGYGLALVPKSRRVDRSYSLLADDTVLGRNRYSSLDRSRYNDAIASSPYISDPTEHLAPLSSSYDPLRRYLRSPSFDLSASRTRYHSADFGMDAALDVHPTMATTGLGSSTLPRKYPSNLSESKTADYYEELLAPTGSEYLPIRRPSPVSIDYLSNRCENGYYNGTSELRSSNSASKRNPYKENATNADFVDRDDYRSTEPRRSRSNSDATVESVQPTTCTTDRS